MTMPRSFISQCTIFGFLAEWTSKEKTPTIIRIPKIVFESSNKFKSEFISALFDCDGYINSDGRYLDYSSKSKKFLEDLQILLTHFNIESVIRIKNAKCNGKIFENYRLFITDNNSVENFKKIGFNFPQI